MPSQSLGAAAVHVTVRFDVCAKVDRVAPRARSPSTTARVIPSGPGTPTPLGVAEPMRLSRLRFRRWMALDRCGSRVPLQVKHGDQQWMMGTIIGSLSGHGSVTVSVVAGGPERSRIMYCAAWTALTIKVICVGLPR